MNRYMQIVNKYHIHMIISGGVLGANVGMYNSVSEKELVSDTVFNVVGGIVLGGMGGSLFPYFAPIAILSVPGYAIANFRSSLQVSPQKEETQVTQMK